MSQQKASEESGFSGEFRPESRLRRLSAPVGPGEALGRLSQASKRGRLPGYHDHGDGRSFHIRVFGEPFDRRLIGEVAPAPGGGSEVSFMLKTLAWLPALFIVFAVFTVWPGVWLTDSMLETYYPPSKDWWWIGWWYIPLPAIPLPWAAKSMWRRSQKTATEETSQAIEKIEAALLVESKANGSKVGVSGQAARETLGGAPSVTPSPG